MLDTTGMLRVINPDYVAPLGPYQLPDPGPTPSLPLQQPSPFPNVLVNNPGEDGRSAQDTQSETTLVLGANNTVVVAYNDSFLVSNNSHKFTGYSQSTDGGQSFVDKRSLPTNPNGDAGDPVLARDEVSGRIYLATLSFNSGVVNVFRSDTNGATFRAPVNGAPRANALWDKDWLTVDNFPGAGQGNVYLVVRDFGSGNGIFLFRSTNGGDTWTPSGGRLIVSAAQGNVEGAWVTVGPDHAVYVSWLDQRLSTERILMKKSTDGGSTFGPERVVTTLRATRVNGDLGLGPFRSNAWAQVAVNPATGAVYAVYPDKGIAGPDRADIFFRQSSDGGATWSAAVRVNDDATNRDQWQPALAVTPSGNKIGIFWYDRRNDPANNLIDRYGVIGTVGGDTVTFAANFRITDQAFPPVVNVDPVIASDYMGDYDQAVATRSHFYLTWGDNRSKSLGHAGNNADVRFAAISLAVAGPAIIASTPRSDTFGDVSRVRVVFDAEIQVASFTPDKIVSFTGPGGNISVTGITVVPNTGNTQFDVSFATQHSLGNYSMVIGPDILDADGRPMDQNDNGIPGETPGDQYVLKFTIQGPKIIGSTPAGKLLGPVSSARVTFNEPVDRATFTTDKIFAFKGPKGFIDIAAVTAVAGSNNTQFDIRFALQGTTGRYEMDIGPDILDLAGHAMDQNGNFSEGEVPGDRYAMVFGLQGPQIIASTPSDFGPGLLSSVQVTFNEPIDSATFTLDQIASFVRTVGATETDLHATLIGVTPVAGSNNSIFNVNFAATGTTGRYRMVIGPEIRDKFGNQMDQNDNLIPGEVPADQYTLNFSIAGPKIVFSQPETSDTPILSIRVGFNETMDLSTFTPATTHLTGPNGDLPVWAVVPVPGTSFTQFDIAFPPATAAGRYTLLIGPDILDRYGNQMDQDGDLIPGEISQDQYTAKFGIFGPRIIASTPSVFATESVDHVRVTFNEPIDVSTFSPEKIASFTGPEGPIPVTNVSAVPFTGNTQFDITFEPHNITGSYTMVIGPDIRDLYGNEMDQDQSFIAGEIPNDQFTAQFTLFTVDLMENGDFEAGGGSFFGWSIRNQANGSGDWFIQMGTTSPVSGFLVPEPPGPTHAAMTDTGGPGSHILFQDFVVPTGITAALLSFDRFIGNRANVFVTPNTLDFSNGANQQARVDIITTRANPFSVASRDVLLNIFQTGVDDPAISGYTTQTTDLTEFLAAHEGQTLRLRFAEVDNQSNFQFGVDRVFLVLVDGGGGPAALRLKKASTAPSASVSAAFAQGAALFIGTRNTGAAPAMFATPLPSRPLILVPSAPAPPTGLVLAQKITYIDRLFAATGTEDRSKHARLVPAASREDEGVTAGIFNDSVPF